MITLLRTMTRKSIVGFGRYPDWRVDDFFQMNKNWELISMYYNLAAVSFSEDVLMDLKITPERRIPKPSKDNDAYKQFSPSILADLRAEQNEKVIMGLASSRKKAKRQNILGAENILISKQRNRNAIQRLGVKK